MLIWMRNSAFAGVFKFLLMGLLLMAVVGLILMDRNGSFSGNMGVNTVAKGPGISIGAMEFDRTVRRALASQGIGAPEAYKLGLVSNILTSEIQNRLFSRETRSFGLEVGDDDVKRQISKLAEPLATEGRTKKEALQQILRQQGISESEFIGTLRQEMANGLLRGALQPPAQLSSPLMARTLYRYDNEKRKINAVILKNAALKDVVKPTDDQLQKYYEANKQDYLIPETRTITVATLKADMLKKNVKIGDAELKAEYEKNIASFTKPQRRLVEQAVLKTEDEAKKALESMKSGKPMKDSVSKDAYNGEQDYEQQGLLPEIATPVFEAKDGAVVGPIQTALGWHILLVKKTLPEEVSPFEEVKEKLRPELENIAMTNELYNAGNTIEDRAAAGDKLEDIVSEYGMTTEIIGPFRQNGMDKDGQDLFKSYGTDRDKLIQSAYDFDAGEIAPVVETSDGLFHLIRIDQVTPDMYRDYKTVKDELEKRWISEQQKLGTQALAKAALDKLNAGGTLDDIAKENGVPVQTFDNVNRQDTPPAPLTAVVAAQAFSTDKGKAFSSAIDGGFIVGTVEDISLPSAEKADEKKLAELKDLTGRSLSQDILAQYVASLTKGKDIKINRQTLDQMYGQAQDAQVQ